MVVLFFSSIQTFYCYCERQDTETTEPVCDLFTYFYIMSLQWKSGSVIIPALQEGKTKRRKLFTQGHAMHHLCQMDRSIWSRSYSTDNCLHDLAFLSGFSLEQNVSVLERKFRCRKNTKPPVSVSDMSRSTEGPFALDKGTRFAIVLKISIHQHPTRE